MRLVLRNATLIDCVSPEPVAGVGVVVEDGRIVEITRGGSAAGGGWGAGDRCGGGVPAAGVVGRAHSPGLREGPERHGCAADGAVRGEPDERNDRGRGGGPCGAAGRRTSWTWAWRDTFASGGLDGPRVFASGIFLTTTGRPLPHVRARARVRRPLRVRQRGAGADQERRESYQAEPVRRGDGAVLGPARALVPAGRGAGGGVRALSPSAATT